MLELIPIFVPFAIIFWFIFDKIKYGKYPPGPVRFPIIGNLMQIARESSYPAVALKSLAKKYGDVLYLRMGFQETIVLNSIQSIKDIRGHEYCRDVVQDIPQMIWDRMNRKNLGLVFCNGREWQTLRRFTIRTLRDFGFGKAMSMDVVINEEASKFIRHLEEEMLKKPEGIEDTTMFLAIAIMNTIWRLVTGVSYEMNDERMLRLLNLSHEFLKSSSMVMNLSIAYPFLYDMFPNLMGKTEQIKNIDKLKEFIQETIDHHRSLGDYKTSPNCYVDVFLQKIEEEEGVPDTVFTNEQLSLCVLDLYQAGADTTGNTLSFSILYMIIYENVQRKVQKEIDSNLGTEEEITFASRKKLPYTYATVLECARFSTVIPNPVAQKANQDFYYKGHLIKKNMVLTSNVYGAHFDEDLWGDPFNFRPERFLTEDVSAMDSKVSANLFVFGHGPRSCIGASLGESALFVYLATILRKFDIAKASPSDVLTVEPQLGMTYYPKTYKAKYLPRNKY